MVHRAPSSLHWVKTQPVYTAVATELCHARAWALSLLFAKRSHKQKSTWRNGMLTTKPKHKKASVACLPPTTDALKPLLKFCVATSLFTATHIAQTKFTCC